MAETTGKNAIQKLYLKMYYKNADKSKCEQRVTVNSNYNRKLKVISSETCCAYVDDSNYQ